MADVAVFLRVSTEGQNTDNQVPDVDRFVSAHGHNEVARYTVHDSAWDESAKGASYRATLKRVMDDAWAGKFRVLIVWSLDRICREGAEELLRLVRQLRERGCILVSIQESWLNGAPEVQDVLVAFAGWRAQQESARRSQRVRAGLARRKAEGLPVGRQPGAVDAKPRRRSGYVARWERERAEAS